MLAETAPTPGCATPLEPDMNYDSFDLEWGLLARHASESGRKAEHWRWAPAQPSPPTPIRSRAGHRQCSARPYPDDYDA